MRRFFTVFIAGFSVLALFFTLACNQTSDSASKQTSQPAPSATSSGGEGKASAPNASMGAIKIGSRPSGASVLLIADEGGEAGKPQMRGTSPTTIADLTPGKYTVHLELKGYKYFQKAVEVKAGETVPVTAELQRQ